MFFEVKTFKQTKQDSFSFGRRVGGRDPHAKQMSNSKIIFEY